MLVPAKTMGVLLSSTPVVEQRAALCCGEVWNTLGVWNFYNLYLSLLFICDAIGIDRD